MLTRTLTRVVTRSRSAAVVVLMLIVLLLLTRYLIPRVPRIAVQGVVDPNPVVVPHLALLGFFRFDTLVLVNRQEIKKY